MALLVTFSCYGNHLPGDSRGSFDHVRNGERKFLGPNPALEAWSRSHLRQPPFLLDTSDARSTVLNAIVNVCEFRAWHLHALHVRTTHVHGIVDVDCLRCNVIRDWKSYATRALRSQKLAAPDRLVWAHGGNSTTILGDRLDETIRYVLEQQGEPMHIYRTLRAASVQA